MGRHSSTGKTGNGDSRAVEGNFRTGRHKPGRPWPGCPGWRLVPEEKRMLANEGFSRQFDDAVRFPDHTDFILTFKIHFDHGRNH